MSGDFQVSHAFRQDGDIRDAFQKVAKAIEGKLRFRGIFGSDSVTEMRPGPQEFDCWVVDDGTQPKFYLQVQVRGWRRVRIVWDCDIEVA